MSRLRFYTIDPQSHRSGLEGEDEGDDENHDDPEDELKWASDFDIVHE